MAIFGKFASRKSLDDCVAIGEARSDEVATTFSLALGPLGNVRTTTLGVYEGRVCSDGEEVALAAIARADHLHLVVSLDASASPSDQECRVSTDCLSSPSSNRNQQPLK